MRIQFCYGVAACFAFSVPTLAAPVHIIAEGDSLTYGLDPNGPLPPINGDVRQRSSDPYPEALQVLLGSCATVENHGFPGDRSNEALRRWKSDKADIFVIMYGTNDALNYGRLPGGPNPIETFQAKLTDLVKSRQGKVILLSPPPVANPEENAKLDVYSSTVASVARSSQSLFINTREVLPTANIWIDGVHLKAPAYVAIARAIAQQIPCQSRENR